MKFILIAVAGLIQSVSLLEINKFPVLYNKCCKRREVIVDEVCKETNTSEYWSPKLLKSKWLKEVDIDYIYGYPKCGKAHVWTVYDKSYDRIRFLIDGSLRHYLLKDAETPDSELTAEQLYYDYKAGTYCSDKTIDSKTGDEILFALVCVPEVQSSWNDINFVMTKVVDPIFHVTSLICYLAVAHIHFVLPQLRDLFGNIVATVNLCLAVAQAADIARIVTNFGDAMTNFIAEVALCVSVLSAYLWLTGLGFYLWRTFRSENVFLRMTHGRKYCYYSCCIWLSAVVLTATALFAHFFLDLPQEDDVIMPVIEIGWLVKAIFYLPIACCLIVNACFYRTTSACMKLFGRYGRIHHRFRICVDIFGRLHLAMSIYWAFLALSWLPFRGVYYGYMIVNALIAPVILYISVLSQRRVRFLLRKECCFEKCICPCLRPNQSDDIPEWGEEMMAIYR